MLLEVFNDYGDALVACCDGALKAFRDGIQRASRFMQGICLHSITLSMSSLISKFVKRLGVRLVHLRVALGLSSSHHHSSPRKSLDTSGSESDDSLNTRVAEILGRRLRSQDHHVIDDKMLVPCALRGLQLTGRLNQCVTALNHELDSSINAIIISLRKSNSSCLLQFFAQRLNDNRDDTAELRTMLAQYGRGALPPQLGLGAAGKRLRGIAGSVIIDLCSVHSNRLLQHFSEESIWGERGDLPTETDGALPQPTITQVIKPRFFKCLPL